MAIKKSGPPGNPGGRTSQKISSTVTVLGPKLPGFTGLSNPPRASLKPKQMDEARALAARLKAKEAKAAAEKKANAKIIKSQNKSAASKTVSKTHRSHAVPCATHAGSIIKRMHFPTNMP